ncbi:hypothetical protein P3T76_004093 [Phytophthora citrophthora]|uniref:Uncharacterized protein n=1 Tax=Phytophthora citrophthora TaxID=4793 RepID=A0AAD9LPZ1_9STRA|nr:hypothetical protein P3T76_004093 [Phytophthora citrophthora]
MEILEEQLQSLPSEQSTTEDHEAAEATVISRRQTELEAEKERLQRTAQNFSLEWKSFLGYAMKIKQQRVSGNPPTNEKDLEDLLLRTQGGLLLLRDLNARRDQQWKEVTERYRYPQSVAKDEKSVSILQKPWLKRLVSKLLLLNEQVATTAHCAAKTPQFTNEKLLKLRARALETHHRLNHGLENSSDFVDVQRVHLLLQFNHLKHQQAVVLERFCARLKYLPISHRFHLRQRMLALIHQQKVKNTRTSDHLHCPLFIVSTAHFTAELKGFATRYYLPIQDYPALRQGADEFLSSIVANFPADSTINTDRSLEIGLETVVHTYTRNSRWELIQRGYLGNCEPGFGPIEDTLSELRNDHKIDSLLANEWELLSLDDTGYLRVRLEALSRGHMTRAKVDLTEGTSAMNNQRQVEDKDEIWASSWDPDALYALYVLRVASCRANRLSLLRLLNYFHFVQCYSGELSHWKVTKYENGDYIVMRAKEDEDSEDNKPREFIFASARRDLEVLELQMLRIASIFIFKQEYDSLPSSPRKRNNEAESVVATIDRLQVLGDIYDCEVAFQQTKVQLVDKLLETGLQFSPRSRDFDNLGFTGKHPEPFTDILLPLLQRRPYLDFSHAYFFESYATETILLELQTSLILNIQQHFKQLEWIPLEEFAVGDDTDEQYQGLCRQILGRQALVQLYRQQDELVREADEKWFIPTCIGDFHALQHALLEQTLVTWSLIIKLELPDRPVRSLERSAGDLMLGIGWQLVLPPQLLSDVSQTLVTKQRSLVECLAKALELEDWRQKLAKSVYEANLLEKILQFHLGFVKQASALDTVGESRYLAFFFAYGDCDQSRTLQSIAIELETPLSASAKPIDDSKSTSEWLLNSLRSLNDDDIATQAKYSGNWRDSVLKLQIQYVSHLRVHAKYQDAVGADVFEFAASYPYVCLASTLSPESADKMLVSMDLNTVRAKYAKEIADKMMEEMRTSCFPYWTRLETLKQQLQNDFTTAPDQSDGLAAAFAVLQPGYHLELDMESCGQYLDQESSHPHLLLELNDQLQRLRNEKKLMMQLSHATRARCAFITENSSEEEPSGLTKWLMVKLHQLKVDLQIHERPKVEQLLLTPPSNSSSTSNQRTKRNNETDIQQTLIHNIPSFQSLLQTFGTISNYDKAARDASGTASAHATRLHEYREGTVRSLASTFHRLNCSLDLLRIRCGSRFRSTSGKNRHLKVPSDPNNVHSGLVRLERWQTLYHHKIRQLLDQLTSKLSSEAALATDLFHTHPDNLQSQQYASLLRQEVYSALQEVTEHSIRMIRCTSSFALLQTYQKDACFGARKRRELLIKFQFFLDKITVEDVQDQLRQLVKIGEQAWFGEARPLEYEKEWQAFNDAIGKYEPRDSAYIEEITRLLQIHRIYIDENCRAARQSQCTAENEALVALDALWERFHLPVWDSLGDEVSQVVGGDNLHMKKRLLGSELNVGASASASSPKDLSYAIRSLQMGATTALAQFCNAGLLVLPPLNSVEEQLRYLHLSIELTWVTADLKELEEQYKNFLLHRKTHREHQRPLRKPTRSPQPASTSPSLLKLSKYYHEDGVESVTGKLEPVFVVPASEMSCFVQELTTQCVSHSKQQLDLHNASMQQLNAQFQAASLHNEKLESQQAKAKAEERIRREAFAADHAFHLYFEVEALRKQLGVLEARRELDQQMLRCDLNAEYNEKLQVMHVELLNKQHKFAEYRTTMQRELQSVIQGAHSQFIDQLLDYSGSIPSTTKSSVSHLLRGQQDIVRIKSENAAMKQALLKVQALGDMQHQTQTAARERELLITQRFTTAEALQRNEVEQLQTYVKQLESNLSKLSQEKTFFQVKWTTAQKQMETTAQRKREAKVRALSATYNRPGNGDEGLPAIFPGARAVPESTSDTDSVMDINIRPQTAAIANDMDRQRLETQYLNSTRHYQNEIRRLQQQVTREIREKAAIADQLNQLRKYESLASIQTQTADLDTPRRSQSASPRANTRPHSSIVAPPDRTIPRRPNTSFSPRASMPRAPQSPAPSISRPSTASSFGTPARKFQVVKREINALGGVAGVANSFSVREPLPYR